LRQNKVFCLPSLYERRSTSDAGRATRFEQRPASRMLEALCARVDGNYVYSQIYLPYGFDLGDISNCDGELVIGDCGYL
jgi:hypothetical protein